MTYPINYQNQGFPAYSGVTINVTNPALNTAPVYGYPYHNNCNTYYNPYPQAPLATNPMAYQAVNDMGMQQNPPVYQEGIQNAYANAPAFPMAYPAYYYTNNYNNLNSQLPTGENQAINIQPQELSERQNDLAITPEKNNNNSLEKEIDLSSSREIIENLNNRVAEQQEKEKTGKKVRVVALTDEYIMSLEKYLDNPNSEIRLMAAKDVLTRLDEDKDRYDDAALNALVNKMLQDPNKLVRIAALSALSSQLASGNDYTVQLLNNIKNNPNADKDDVLQVANILLKMSTTTETKYVPIKEKAGKKSNNELEAAQAQNEQLRKELQKYKEKEYARILDSQGGGV